MEGAFRKIVDERALEYFLTLPEGRDGMALAALIENAIGGYFPSMQLLNEEEQSAYLAARARHRAPILRADMEARGVSTPAEYFVSLGIESREFRNYFPQRLRRGRPWLSHYATEARRSLVR